MARTRAAAIVVRDGHVLLMRRRRDGQEYWVVPGGGIEPGESAVEACLRELAEETSLVGDRADRVHTDPDLHTHYFLVSGARGEPQLGGAEAARNCAANRYRLDWVRSDALPRMLRPESARRAIAAAVNWGDRAG